MTILVRKNVADLLPKITSAHAGLMMQRALESFSSPNPAKENVVKTVAESTVPDFYYLAFSRWVGITQQQNRFQAIAASLTARLFTGLSIGGTLETGVITHHTYGVPMLAGSSVKGAVRSYAETLQLPKEYIQVLFGSGDDSESSAKHVSGALVWHDAWWVPVPKQKPFVAEVVTVHHQQYYSGLTNVADGTESPIPNQQLAVQGGFYFVIEGPEQWASFACDLLTKMLEEQGMGAKTASGYGSFELNNQTVQNTIKDIIETQQLDLSDPVEVLRFHIKNMDGNTLDNDINYDRYLFLSNANIQDDDVNMLEALKQACLDFHPEVKIHKILNDLINEAKSSVSNEATLESTIQGMSEKALIESLSKKWSSFCHTWGLDKTNESHKKHISQLVLQYHQDKVAQWSNSTSSNTVTAFNFVKKHKPS